MFQVNFLYNPRTFLSIAALLVGGLDCKPSRVWYFSLLSWGRFIDQQPCIIPNDEPSYTSSPRSGRSSTKTRRRTRSRMTQFHFSISSRWGAGRCKYFYSPYSYPHLASTQHLFIWWVANSHKKSQLPTHQSCFPVNLDFSWHMLVSHTFYGVVIAFFMKAKVEETNFINSLFFIAAPPSQPGRSFHSWECQTPSLYRDLLGFWLRFVRRPHCQQQ